VKRRTEIIFDPQPSRVEIEKAPLQIRVRRPSTFLPEATEGAIMTLFHPPCAEVNWDLTLKPRTPFSITLHILVAEGESLPEVSAFDEGLSQLEKSYDDWLSQCTKLETTHELFNQLLKRSAMDLRLLMERTPQGAVPTAGIPWFACVFGRDSLLTSLQTLMLNPEIAKSTLRYLAAYQGTEVNPWRDEERGVTKPEADPPRRLLWQCGCHPFIPYALC
jgi:glycogen debranching enzyme